MNTLIKYRGVVSLAGQLAKLQDVRAALQLHDAAEGFVTVYGSGETSEPIDNGDQMLAFSVTHVAVGTGRERVVELVKDAVARIDPRITFTVVTVGREQIS